MIAVILAGGGGTRLWPMSRKSKPKQFFDIASDEVMIRDTYNRIAKLIPEDKIYFSIRPDLETHIRDHFPNITTERLIIEPERRDTGPAMGYVAALLEKDHADETLIFVPSDHYIGDDDLFLKCLRVGDKLVQETGKLLDIGIKPSSPHTGYGYTKIGEIVEGIEGVEIHEFKGHTEKPDYETAKKLMESGEYLWHANYYMWTPAKFMKAFETYAPKAGETLRAIQESPLDASLYSELPKKSIDYLITEHLPAGEMLVIRGEFPWSDVGTWEMVYDQLSDGEDNVLKGKCIAIESKGNIVYGSKKKLIALMGMEDTVVIDTDDATLVCKRSDAQRIKELVAKIEESHEDHL